MLHIPVISGCMHATFLSCDTLNRLLRCNCACWSCFLFTCCSFLPLLSVMQLQLCERGGRTLQTPSSSAVDVWGSAWHIIWPKVAWRMWCCWRSLSWRLDPPGTPYVWQSLLFYVPAGLKGLQVHEYTVNVKVDKGCKWQSKPAVEKTQVICVCTNTLTLLALHIFLTH